MKRGSLGLFLGALLLAPVAGATQTTVWRIGRFDHSSGEFASTGVRYCDPSQNPVYVIGKNTAKDWPRFQPGPANGMACGREHPYTILFDLPTAPRGVYRLKISILYETPRLSYLRVDLNGHAGLFYFHPRLDYGAGDWEGTYVPQTSWDSKTIDLPTAWLRRGVNRIVLTALDEPAEVENSFGTIALGHTGLIYDALEFDQDPQGHYAGNRLTASATPTIFYHRASAGLSETVEADLSFATIPQAGEADLIMSGETFLRTFSSREHFGEVRLKFSVPEWQGTVPATLTIRADGQARSFPLHLTAAKKWTVFLIPLEHLDIGFTDYPATVAELHAQVLDEVLKAMGKQPDFRWTLDGYWAAEKYLAGRSAAKDAELIERMREGKIVLPPQYANLLTGTASLEELIRSLYDSHFFAERRAIPSADAAHLTDVPSYSWSYASVLHDAGVKSFVAGSNAWRAPVLLLGRWNEKSPFYWEGPDGGRILMWYSRAYAQLASLFATPQRLAAGHDSLPVFLQAYSRPDYKASASIIFGTQLENTPFSQGQVKLPGEWNRRYAWPRLEFSTFAQAMDTLKKQFGDAIPTYRGDFGPYWEDGVGSDAFYAAIDRANQQRILSAEKMGALAHVLDPNLRPERSRLDPAWHHLLLYGEHTWGYVGATSQPESQQTERQLALKRGHATAARREIAESIERSWTQLDSLVAPREPAVLVFNSLNWARSGFVTTDLPNGIAIFDPVTGREVPVETVFVGKTTTVPGFGDGYRRVRFLAENVPALGYKTYWLRPATPLARRGKESPTGLTFENRYYRVAVDAASGALRSIWDKQLGKELVDPASPYRFGTYVYVEGADSMPHNSLYRYGLGLQPPKLTAIPAGHGRLGAVRREPWGTVLVLESSAPHTPLVRTEITLLSRRKEISFRYAIRKDYVLRKEAAYIAFPFAMIDYRFAYDSQNGWIDPGQDELTGGSREWYCATHWAAIQSSGEFASIIPVDTPLVSFGDIVRGKWPSEFHPASATIFSWLMNNYWETNYVPGQGGTFIFRYDMTSGPAFDATALTRAGWEAMTPLESIHVPAASQAGILPPGEASLLSVSAPDVVAVTWKLAEDGQGTILRLEEITRRAATVKLGSPYFAITKAWKCSAVEDNQSPLAIMDGKISVPIGPYQILTLRLLTEPRSKPSVP